MEAYNVIQHLGRGTYGNVFLCEKIHNKQKVVMKKIQCETTSEIIIQAKNEAKILKMLKHPNIIEYFDSYFRDNEFHIIMEYAQHGTLYEYIKVNKPDLLSKEFVISTFTQILLGLDQIHNKFIIQRDLKTENIFLSGPNRNVVKIGDFGISKTLQNIDKTKTTIGTPNYLAPEVCEGKPYGRKSDIWSLGCVLYEMCALERLFSGPMAKVIMDIKSGVKKTIPIYQYGHGVQNIVNLCINVDPKRRPTTKSLLAHAEVIPMHASLMVNLANYCFPRLS
ncbi:serine/threonine-protein kinase Nek8-like [Atheta coriaria]|uniref:serine/threonine-protein kinase Nek8-like n=1 Tax=Dalotia coriaria TaxID=877792 RepID=UPI0031F42F39